MNKAEMNDYRIGEKVRIEFYESLDFLGVRTTIRGEIIDKDEKGPGYLDIKEEGTPRTTILKIALPPVKSIINLIE